MAKPDRAPARRFAAFISYRHADNKDEGRRWADWIHHSLETYEVPRSLVGKPNQRGDAIPATLYPVFRDEVELPADADLTENIRGALENSDALIVLCSPRACASRFVSEEIRIFKELGKSDRILALMLDGEPNASSDPAKRAAGIPAEAECLPERLRRGVPRPDGTIDWDQMTEPIAADVRPGNSPEQGWTSASAYRLALERSKAGKRDIRKRAKDYGEQLNLAKIKLIAGLLGVSLGELRKRDAAYRAQRFLRLALILGLLALTAVVAGAFALRESWRATAALREVKRVLAQADYLHANELVEKGDTSSALAFLARATRNESRPAADRIFSLLTQRSWPMARTPSLEHLQGAEARGVTALQFSPDGRVLATAADDGTVRLWDSATGKLLRKLGQHRANVLSLRFSPSGRRLVSASWDGTARVWNCEPDALPELTLQHRHNVQSACFSPDGSQVLTASWDGTAGVWNATTGDRIWAFPHSGIVITATYDPQGTRVLTTAADRTPGVWDAKTGKTLFSLKHEDNVPTAAWSSDGKRIVTGSDDKTAMVWDASSGQLLWQARHRQKVVTVDFSPDGTRVATGAEDGTAQLWDADTGKAIGPALELGAPARFIHFAPDGRWLMTGAGSFVEIWESRTGQPASERLEHQGKVSDCSFSADGRSVATGTNGGEARVWDIEPGEAAARVLRHQNAVTSARFSADGKSMFATSVDGAASILSLETGRVNVFRHSSWVNGGDWTADQKYAAVACEDNAARVWEVATGRLRFPPLGHRQEVMMARFSRDGGLLATASLDHTARVWNAQTGEPVTAPLPHERAVRWVEFSPDGRLVATASDDSTARVWSVETGQPVTPPLKHAGEVFSARFSPDGLAIVTASRDRSARVWKLPSGDPAPYFLQHGDAVVAAEFSPDGCRVGTASFDRTARVWDVATGKPVTAALPHRDGVCTVSFSPEGRRVVTGSFDKTVRVWDAETGTPLSEPLGHRDQVTSGIFSFDGRQVLSASMDGTARTWDVAPGPNSAPPVWLPELAESSAFKRLNDVGGLSLISAEKQLESFGTLRRGKQGPGDFTKLATWFLSDRRSRAFSPYTAGRSTESSVAAADVQAPQEAGWRPARPGQFSFASLLTYLRRQGPLAVASDFEAGAPVVFSELHDGRRNFALSNGAWILDRQVADGSYDGLAVPKTGGPVFLFHVTVTFLDGDLASVPSFAVSLNDWLVAGHAGYDQRLHLSLDGGGTHESNDAVEPRAKVPLEFFAVQDGQRFRVYVNEKLVFDRPRQASESRHEFHLFAGALAKVSFDNLAIDLPTGAGIEPPPGGWLDRFP